MDITALGLLSLGFWQGLTHALDPDHLVAVSTIVSEQKSLKRSSLVGTFWGLGHTAALLAVGLAVLLLKLTIPEGLAPWLEFPVAVMLMALGGLTIWKAARDRGVGLHAHPHRHGGGPSHTHLHLHDGPDHDHRHLTLRLGRRPFVVGLVHGVAGSAALMLATLATTPSVAVGLLFIALFGVGSVGGMLLMSALVGLPFAATARRFGLLNDGFRMLAGAGSLLFGLWLAYELAREIGGA